MIYSILVGISLGPSTTEILGSVRSRNGKQQRPDKKLPSYIYPTKLTRQSLFHCIFQFEPASQNVFDDARHIDADEPL